MGARVHRLRAAIALAGLAVELRLFAPQGAPRRGQAIVWGVGWLLLAGAATVGIGLAGGSAGEWTTVYPIERSLSLDNVFLFSLLLAYFVVPAELRGGVIVIGIAGGGTLQAIAGWQSPVARKRLRYMRPSASEAVGRRSEHRSSATVRSAKTSSAGVGDASRSRSHSSFSSATSCSIVS